jgi:DNA helicase-2/ATP-dependent DNA helicase PcrA
MQSFGSTYATPGWQRAQARGRRGGFEDETQDFDDQAADRREAPRAPKHTPPRAPLTIEGELVAKSTGTVSPFAIGDRVFHIKFGNGDVVAVEGNKLTIAFDKAGEKRVVDSFVQRA